MTTEQTALVKRGKARLRGLLDQMGAQIAEVLPRHLTPERMAKLVLVEASRNPDLYRCVQEDPASVAGCLMLASELGLEPSSPLGHFWLIPRREKRDPKDKSRNPERVWRCTAIIGYKGFAELARRSPDVARLNAGVVYAEELEGRPPAFEWNVEPPAITHRGRAVQDRGDRALRFAYAVAELVDGQRYQAVLDAAEVDKRRQRAGTQMVWKSDTAAMWRKTAIRALLGGGLVPLSAELVRAVSHERAQEVEPVVVEDADVVEPAQRQTRRSDPVRAALGMDEDPEEAEEVQLEKPPAKRKRTREAKAKAEAKAEAKEPAAEAQAAADPDAERTALLAVILDFEGELPTKDVAEAAKAAGVVDPEGADLFSGGVEEAPTAKLVAYKAALQAAHEKASGGAS